MNVFETINKVCYTFFGLGLEYDDSIPARRVRPPSPVKKKIASDGEAPVLELCGEWNTPSLPLLPRLLWSGVVVSIRVQSMGWLDMFKMRQKQTKKLLGINYAKNVNMNIQWMRFYKLDTQNNPRRVDMAFSVCKELINVEFCC